MQAVDEVVSVVGDVGDPGEKLVGRDAQVMYELPLFEIPDEHGVGLDTPSPHTTFNPLLLTHREFRNRSLQPEWRNVRKYLLARRTFTW